MGRALHLPVFNFRTPEITRSLLKYRYRRLDEARAAAAELGLRGAMCPWQSGSDGQEEHSSRAATSARTAGSETTRICNGTSAARSHTTFGSTSRSRKKHLDLILGAEDDSSNAYKASKQADVLMLFCVFSADELRALFARLGYDLPPEAITRNVQYYDSRSTHGSTLSRVVHAWVERLFRSEQPGRGARGQPAEARTSCRVDRLQLC